MRTVSLCGICPFSAHPVPFGTQSEDSAFQWSRGRSGYKEESRAAGMALGLSWPVHECKERNFLCNNSMMLRIISIIERICGWLSIANAFTYQFTLHSSDLLRRVQSDPSRVKHRTGELTWGEGFAGRVA